MKYDTDIIELTSIDQVETFMGVHKKLIIFKAGTCWITDRAWDILQKVICEYTDIPLAFIAVVKNRPVSNYIAEITGTRHQSPQILILQSRTVLFERNNLMIDDKCLKDAIQKNFGLLQKLAIISVK
jgi:bacillithiol system protein YtxJ